MNAEGRQSAAASELSLADDELQAAEGLVEMGHHRIALTRAYFAVFHAVRARLFAENLTRLRLRPTSGVSTGGAAWQ